jgi:hypothetical protein
MARRKAVQNAFFARLLATRNPWVLAAAGVVFAVRYVRQRAAEGKSIGFLSRVPGLTPGSASRAQLHDPSGSSRVSR